MIDVIVENNGELVSTMEEEIQKALNK
jgi:hypothetical protein